MNRRLDLVPLITALFLLVGCGGAASSPAASTASPGPTLPSPSATASASFEGSSEPSEEPSAQPANASVKAYFVLYQGSDDSPGILVPVHRDIEATPAVARAAMTALLAGPTEDERAHNLVVGTVGTAIHPDTRLLGVEVANGVATVDLSADFVPLDLDDDSEPFFLLALAQVTYTLTQFPTVDRVAFRIEGEAFEPIEAHEGTTVTEVTRDAYADLLPTIFLDEPAWGAPREDRIRIAGLAQVFEAQFQAALVDAETGEILVEQSVMADCGETGCTLPGGGPFSAELTVPASAAGRDVNVRVWEPSAQDGTPTSVVEYPLR